MHTQSDTPPTNPKSNVATGVATRIGTVAIFIALQAVLLFLAAGRIDWTWAWVYLGICLVIPLVNGTIMLRTNLETVAERGRPKGTADWDKVVSSFFALALYLVLPLVAGLDARFGWTRELNIAWNAAGAFALVAGFGLASWAMIANAFFSTGVRIQDDRGHTVCRTGPYQFVRHPGYVGFILQSLGTPLLLGSWWALVPGLAATAFMVIRTAFEDRMLQAELPGYRDFVQEVRYRLVPGIW